MLSPYKDDNIIIYCPLSYGIFLEYRDKVIKMGKDLFGEKFVPMTEFMKLDEYLFFINTIDLAIFNHKRQEAMGVILHLLYYGKVVYMNKNSTSFKSFKCRGFKVFDNDLIKTDGLFTKRDVYNNPEMVYAYYNYKILLKSLSDIFND